MRPPRCIGHYHVAGSRSDQIGSGSEGLLKCLAAGAGWGYFILNLFLLLAVADAMVATLAAIFTMRSHNWRTAGKPHLAYALLLVVDRQILLHMCWHQDSFVVLLSSAWQSSGAGPLRSCHQHAFVFGSSKKQGRRQLLSTLAYFCYYIARSAEG